MADTARNQATSALDPPTTASRRWREVGQAIGAAAFLLLLLLYNVIFNADAFLSLQALRLNLTQVATIVIVGVGMTLVIATGGIDLSVGSLMAISGAMAPLIFLSDWPLLSTSFIGGSLAYIIPITVAGMFGLFNGWLITAFGLQPIIATLVLFVAGRGIAQVMTDGRLQSFREPDWQFVGLGRIVGIPFQAILMIAVVALAGWALRSTSFGRNVLAIGGNEAAARLAGVPVKRVKLAVYAISGLLAGLAGLIVIAINSSSDANQVGLNMELDAIAAVAVGGTSLMGGKATVVGTLIGALIIQLIRFTLLTQGVSDAVARIVTAAAIIIGVLAQRRRAS
ncbi:MAG: ABC transporter permease [Chloroflexota bacterium]|nr:ABC transporter permease [Chloroflexota bacterium]